MLTTKFFADMKEVESELMCYYLYCMLFVFGPNNTFACVAFSMCLYGCCCIITCHSYFKYIFNYFGSHFFPL